MKSDTRVGQLLRDTYALAERQVASADVMQPSLRLAENIDAIVRRAEASKGVLAVFFTSMVYKILNPDQDVRKHQVSIPGGYSGRTFDTHYITPFLKQNDFPAMAESGWLTRSLEHKEPYTKGYSGAIQGVKNEFLEAMDFLQVISSEELRIALCFTMCRLIQERERKRIQLALPANLTIDQTLALLRLHFHDKYMYEGVARLPVLAIYSIYQLLMEEVKRYQGMVLCKLESHTTSDTQSGRLGDIDIVGADGTPFESIEIKHNIPIDEHHVKVAYSKFNHTKIERYYILTTSEIGGHSDESLVDRILAIKNIHGCQVVVNGVLSTIQYYLRLIKCPSLFVERYIDNMRSDSAVKFEHRERWNVIVSSAKFWQGVFLYFSISVFCFFYECLFRQFAV